MPGPCLPPSTRRLPSATPPPRLENTFSPKALTVRVVFRTAHHLVRKLRRARSAWSTSAHLLLPDRVRVADAPLSEYCTHGQPGRVAILHHTGSASRSPRPRARSPVAWIYSALMILPVSGVVHSGSQRPLQLSLRDRVRAQVGGAILWAGPGYGSGAGYQRAPPTGRGRDPSLVLGGTTWACLRLARSRDTIGGRWIRLLAVPRPTTSTRRRGRLRRPLLSVGEPDPRLNLGNTRYPDAELAFRRYSNSPAPPRGLAPTRPRHPAPRGGGVSSRRRPGAAPGSDPLPARRPSRRQSTSWRMPGPLRFSARGRSSRGRVGHGAPAPFRALGLGEVGGPASRWSRRIGIVGTRTSRRRWSFMQVS